MVSEMQKHTTSLSTQIPASAADSELDSSPAASPIPPTENTVTFIDVDELLDEGYVTANNNNAHTTTTPTAISSFAQPIPPVAAQPTVDQQQEQAHVIPTSEETRSGDGQQAPIRAGTVQNAGGFTVGSAPAQTTQTGRRSKRLAGKRTPADAGRKPDIGKKRPADADASSMQGQKKPKK
jgi:hypothetical protein